jgi:hypothetical protein
VAEPSPETLGLWGTGIAAVSVLLARLGPIVEAIRKMFGGDGKRKRRDTPDHDNTDRRTLVVFEMMASSLVAIERDSAAQTTLIRDLRDESAESHKAQLALQEMQGRDLHMMARAYTAMAAGAEPPRDNPKDTPLGQHSTHRG